MKNIKSLGNWIFWLAVISLPVSFWISSLVGEAEIFGIAGIVRYSWIMWLFIPISVVSVILGKKLKSENEKYKKNYIVALICIPLLLIFGSYRFIFDSFLYNKEEVVAVAEQINFSLPDDLKVATEILGDYKLSYVKIIDEEEKADFENKIKNSEMWTAELGTSINNVLPFNIQFANATYDYFLFYNCENGEYNTYPSYEVCECIFLAYDVDLQRLVVVSDYTVVLN